MATGWAPEQMCHAVAVILGRELSPGEKERVRDLAVTEGASVTDAAALLEPGRFDGNAPYTLMLNALFDAVAQARPGVTSPGSITVIGDGPESAS